MLHQLLSLFAFCCLAMAAFGLGRPLLRGLRVGEDDRLSVIVWSLALGLIAAGLLLLALGLMGALYGPLIGVLTMVAGCWGLGEALRGRLQAAQHRAFPVPNPIQNAVHVPAHDAVSPRAEEPDESPWAPPAGWVRRAIVAAAGIACAGSLIGALAPPTAGDALCYHLELPKRFLLERQILHLPHHDNATFPLLTEMWYLWGLALDGGVCAQLVHWGLGVLLALATVVLATPILGRPWAWIAGAVVVLTPGVTNQMTAPLNDVALTAMTTLTLAAWWQAAVNDEDRRWFLVAGLMAGGALGIKHLALVFAFAVAATWVWMLVRHGKRRRSLLQGAAVVTVVALSVGGPWYARAAWHRGNPVFPFLGEVFGPGDAAAKQTLPESKSPLGRGPLGLAIAPWQVTMHPEQFGGRGHQLGVLFLATLPGLLLVRRLRGLGTLLAVGLGYGLLWYVLRQNVRFLFPAVPPLGVAVVWVWIELRRFPRPAKLLAGAAFACILAAMCVVAVVRPRQQLAVAVGLEDRDKYLLRHEPAYRAAAVANALLDDDAHLLSQDYRAFYFNQRVTREIIYRRNTHYDQELHRGLSQFSRSENGTVPLVSPDDTGENGTVPFGSPNDTGENGAVPLGSPADVGENGAAPLDSPARTLSDRLREAGFTHLLLAETLSGDGIQYDPTLSRLADAQQAANADGLFTLTEYVYTDADGASRHYRLVWLCPEDVARD